jgi:hypothetical protein
MVTENQIKLVAISNKPIIFSKLSIILIILIFEKFQTFEMNKSTLFLHFVRPQSDDEGMRENSTFYPFYYN